MREILTELIAALDERRACVYCSVVETRGSTPQKAGAAMLVFPDGRQVGTLGGGCIEAEVKQKALHVLNTGVGRAEVHTFCLDDNYGWDDGLICGGRMTVLADPVLAAQVPTEHDFFRRYRDFVASGAGCIEAIVIDPKVGCLARYLFDAGGQLTALRGALDIPDAVLRNLPQLQKRPGPCVVSGVAYLPVLPRIRLLIVGGGHVGQAVAKLASEVDFDVWVLDDRERYASRERFPSAERLIVGDIGESLKQLVAEGIDPSDYCLIVTRGHNHDEEALYHLAQTNAGYVGMIGSKRKIKLIYEDLLARSVNEEALARVHAPLGFDIGSQTVPEIAISIVAELIACRNKGTTIPPPRIRVRPGTTAHT